MPLIFKDKHTGGTQIAVISGNVAIGHVRKLSFMEQTIGAAERWHWHLRLDHHALPKGMVRDGYGDTYKEAKAALERNWALWLAATGLTSG